MVLDWLPEIYPASGGLAAAGFYKLLGRPRLDPLTVLVRETAQNSWDARDAGDEPVRFAIAGWNLEPSERQALEHSVFTSARMVHGVELEDHLGDDNLTGIYISDRNTRGLGGPIRADREDPENVYDWVDFVLNVGKPSSQGLSGGTYGFGKTICYVVSAVNSVVVHTRTMHRGRPQTRLIACAIGSEFKHQRQLCTGRHWWGRSSAEGPGPLTGAQADKLAAEIGMPAFEDDELGTNLLIVDPDLAGRSLSQAMTFIAESVTWHLWPKRMELDGQLAMDIEVSCNGETVEIPDPEDRPPLQGFAQAFRVLHEDLTDDELPPGVKLDEIRASRPKAHIGTLVTVPLVQRDRATVDDGHDPSNAETPKPAAMITGPAHHVALLRAPDLVVDYLEGPRATEGGIEWAGVFKCKDEHDHRFALAEPPTHDSWQPELLPKGQDKTIVNVGLREIRGVIERLWTPATPADTPQVTSTAHVADGLAHLVRSTDGRGAGPKQGKSGGSSSHGARIRINGARPLTYQGRPATLLEAVVTPKASSAGTRVRIAVGAALDGTTSDDTLDPDLHLVSASWNGTTADLSGTQETLELNTRTEQVLEILVTRGPTTSVLFDLTAETLEPT
jgi:hypothetical protein